MTVNQLGFVFPGQGSQSVGMLSEIAAQFSEVKQTFAEAADALSLDLWGLVQNGPEEVLGQTVHTQPALLAASYAIWRIIQARISLSPAMLAGHSLGEYTALVCAEVLTFADGIKMVALRGELMQNAVPLGTGGMAAIIGLSDEQVMALCKQAVLAEQVLAPANYNCPGQVVIAGHRASIDVAVTLAKQQGAKMAMVLPVSVPSHCSLMQPAAEQLAVLMAATDWQIPNISVINNVDVLPYMNAIAIRDGLIRQLSKPVRWVETIQAFATAGIDHIVECGPGKILTGLNKRIDKAFTLNLSLMTTADLVGLENVLKQGEKAHD